jgi:hypothetical protein
MNFIPIPKPISKAAVAATKVTVTASQCLLHGLVVVNQTAAEAFLQIFDALAANVTVGTTVPDYVIPIPASGGVVIPLSSVGFEHLIGIVIAGCTSPTNNVGAACDVTLFVK